MTGDLSYEEWITYCFDREVADPQWYWSIGEEGEGDWYQPAPSVLIVYLQRLFTHSDELFVVYTEEQIAQGLYFICSSGSSYFQIVRQVSVSSADQVKWVQSICNLYRDLFAKYCSHFYGHLDSGPEAAKPLNSLCYMFWDLDGIEGAAMFPGEEHLIEPIFEVLACALSQPNPACIESALHGLGHLEFAHPERVRCIIDGFLNSASQIPDELLEYAKNASSGCVQ